LDPALLNLHPDLGFFLMNSDPDSGFQNLKLSKNFQLENNQIFYLKNANWPSVKTSASHEGFSPPKRTFSFSNIYEVSGFFLLFGGAT
jgi:hypothetical protein